MVIKIPKKLINTSFEDLINADYEDIKIEFTEEEAIQYIKESDENFTDPHKVLAYCLFQGLSPSDLNAISEQGNEFDNKYLVLTNEEADEMAESYAQSYCDDVVLPEIPEPYRRFIDEQAVIDAVLYDGRGICLSSYDHSEETQEVDGTTYYIYRVN